MSTQRRRTKAARQVHEESKADFPETRDSTPSRSFRWTIVFLCLALALSCTLYSTERKARPSNEHRRHEEVLDAIEVVDIPGKGKGVMAKRPIKQGELVIREKPLFLVPHQIQASPAALISKLLGQVSETGRQEFLNLSYVNFPKGLKPEDHPDEVALAIFQTNAVSAGDKVGIFPRMARLNHGCSSAFNVVYSWREREGEIVVHALKDIKRGEELLTTYTDTKRPRDERRAYLAEQYGFTCSCAVCSLPDAESRASDVRLSQISDLYRRFAAWGSDGISGIEAVDIVRRIWRLEDEEGYWSERGRLAADAAWVSAAHSDASATRAWAMLATRWYTYELGADSIYVEEARDAAVEPRHHRAWGSRPGTLVVGGPGEGIACRVMILEYRLPPTII